ncbi:hypothetical protein Q4603_05745 [Zobellia galactanivorans]|uniref:hypothetical protein n=1 Tax=Zobellia galactanivorans (strain DSM 12802 / CCUG 47099 / CIP 106680 / NCIMB 13871 / Dsij) TaxID=63186 RepID=UPI0026E3F2C5|nr:hypothetical protein [Zobellia galactanivorans]MDO6808098.1 hypothetical protein [Zobellia galactanivorans]
MSHYTNFYDMRGKTNLHRNLIQHALFSDDVAVVTKSDRLEQVKDKIAARYYYYAAICRMLYADCIRQLESEFDRAERTIIENLEYRRAYIQRLMEEEAGPAELKKLFPYYDWHYRPIK